MQYYMLMVKRVFWNSRNAMVAILVAALAGSVWLVMWVGGRQVLPQMVYTPVPGQEQGPEEGDNADPYAGWATCKDVTDGISFRYPNDWEQPNILENYCSSVPLPGAAFGLASPKGADDTYLIKMHYQGGISPEKPRASEGTSGQKILEVLPLNVLGAKKQLYVVVFADLQYGPDVWEMVVTDQAYQVGQVVEYVALPTNQTDGKLFKFDANLAEGLGQNTHGTYPLSDYRDHPYYSTVLRIFESIQVLE